jgi:cytochrome c2
VSRLIVLLGVAAMLAATHGAGAADAAGNTRRGAALIAQTGCGACHSIRGIANAHGLVGPPLDNIGARTMIAGLLPNTAENMERWLETPQGIVPGNAMPDMGLSRRDAADITAYLEALK